MKTYKLQGSYSIKNWQELEAVLSAVSKDCKIDYSSAVVDKGCLAILKSLNSKINVKTYILTDDRTFFQYFFQLLLNIIKYFSYIFYFLKILNKQPKNKFQREIMIQDIINNCYSIGIQALFIASFFSFFAGITIAIEGVEKLSEFGAGLLTVDLVVVSFFKEMALFLGLIVICARSSAAIIARVGVMRISDEWNAIKTMDLDPDIFLLTPKIIAFVLMTPVLGYACCFAGIIGGFVVLKFMLNLQFALFLQMLGEAVSFSNFILIALKGPVFGLVSGLITAYEAKQVKLHSESLMFHITRGVIYSIFGAIFVNMLTNILKVLIK